MRLPIDDLLPGDRISLMVIKFCQTKQTIRKVEIKLLISFIMASSGSRHAIKRLTSSYVLHIWLELSLLEMDLSQNFSKLVRFCQLSISISHYVDLYVPLPKKIDIYGYYCMMIKKHEL